MSKFGDWLRRRAEMFAQETEKRAKNKEQNKFNFRVLRWGAVVVALVLVGRMLTLATPARDVAIDINQSPDVYHPITQARVFATQKEAPPFAESDLITPQAISLPDKSRKEISALAKSHPTIWYEIRFKIPGEVFQKEKFGLLLPKVFGHSAVYLNGQLLDFGKNIWPIFGLSAAEGVVHLKVSTVGGVRLGIRSSYPPVWGERGALEVIPAQIVQQDTRAYPVAETIHLTIALFFIFIFAMSGAKPEVFAFIAYTLLSAVYGAVFIADAWHIALMGGLQLQQSLLALLAMGRSVALFWFVLEFTRKSKAAIAQWLVNGILVASLGSSLFVFVYRYVFGGEAHLLFQLAQESFFIFFVILAFLDAANLLIREQKGKTPWRVVWFALLAGAVVFSEILNMDDYLRTQEKITTQYIRNLWSFLFATGVVIAEFARKENEFSRVAMVLSRENQDQLRKGSKAESVEHEGFVLLVDGIDWSRRAESLPDEATYQQFVDVVQKHILSRLYSEKTSLLQDTGDGFYIALKMPFSSDSAAQVLKLVLALIREPLDLDPYKISGIAPGEKLHFRAALAYGRYTTSFFKFRDLAKEKASSALCTPLARICGGDRPNLRFIAEKWVDVLPEAERGELVDKRGVKRRFLELSPERLEEILIHQKVSLCERPAALELKV